MYLRLLKTKVFEEESAEDLEAAVNEWLTDGGEGEPRGEETFVHVEFRTDGTSFWAFILYTES